MSHLVALVNLAESMATLATMGIAKIELVELAIRQANDAYCETVYSCGDNDELELLSERIGNARGVLVMHTIAR